MNSVFDNEMTKEEFLDCFHDETLKERATWLCEMEEMVIEKAKEDVNDHSGHGLDPGINLSYVDDLKEWIDMLGDKKQMLLVDEAVYRALCEDEPEPEESTEVQEKPEETQDESYPDVEALKEKLKEWQDKLNGIKDLPKNIDKVSNTVLLSLFLMKKMNQYIDATNRVAEIYDKMLIDEVKREAVNHGE